MSSLISRDAWKGALDAEKAAVLDKLIEAGDWEAVGEAAALMSDASMASASTADIERLAASARLGSGASGATGTRSLRIGGVNAQRARELDEMIDRGDWAGVVEAAGRFNQADKEVSSLSSAGYARPRAPEGDDSEAKRRQQLKEEEDAMAQAAIWMQIAEQSKVEGATGTSD